MDFIPENEMGVIVRFAQEINSIDNISILSIRAKYPDAILLVNGKKIKTEFEYLASNFISHQHDPRECDLIICWIDDVQHKNKLPTWELSKGEWKSLEITKVSQYQKEAFYWECRARMAENCAKMPTQETMQGLGNRLKKALQVDGRPNITQLAKDFGVSRPTLYNRLNSLVDSGEVIKNGNGYEVTK